MHLPPRRGQLVFPGSLRSPGDERAQRRGGRGGGPQVRHGEEEAGLCFLMAPRPLGGEHKKRTVKEGPSWGVACAHALCWPCQSVSDTALERSGVAPLPRTRGFFRGPPRLAPVPTESRRSSHGPKLPPLHASGVAVLSLRGHGRQTRPASSPPPTRALLTRLAHNERLVTQVTRPARGETTAGESKRQSMHLYSPL